MPVTTDSNGDGVQNDPDDGRVVFSNREFQVTSLLGVDVIRLFIGSRSANSFQWITLNVGSGIHTITVKGQLDVQVTGAGMAKAAIGKRTLVVEPAKLANDATVSFSEGLAPPADFVKVPDLFSAVERGGRDRGLRWATVTPNPFRDRVELELSAPGPGRATVDAYNVAGRRVARLFDGRLESTASRVSWDGTDVRGRPLATGVYLVRARMGPEVATTRVHLLR